MLPDRTIRPAPGTPARSDDADRAGHATPRWSLSAPGHQVAAASAILALQRLAGNQAATARVREALAQRQGAGVATRAPATGEAFRAVQRLPIYGQAASEASPLPAATATDFARQVEAGNRAMALSVVVAAMTARGELDTRLLRTSGEGDLWQIRDVGDLAAEVSFRSSFPDPDDPSRRLPNPRFSVSPRMLEAGRPDALGRLHMGILHEFRHVRQAAERVSRPASEGGTRAPGYANDPDEFDAYLSEVEMSFDRMHMYGVALQAGVHWEFLATDDRVPFQARWTAAQARIRRVLGYGVDTLLASPTAERYREQMRAAERRAREAWERHGG